MAGLVGSDSQNVLGSFGIFEGDYLECYGHKAFMYYLDADITEIYRTELLRRYKFPEFENEYFCLESVVEFEISLAGYKSRYYNKIVTIKNYLPDGLTKSGFKIMLDNPCGALLYTDIKKRTGFVYFGIYYEYKIYNYLNEINSDKLNVLFPPEKVKKLENDFDNINIDLKERLNQVRPQKIGIYGLGMTGNDFLYYNISKIIDIQLFCGIDRKNIRIDGLLTLTPEQACGTVDTIIVTISSYSKRLDDELRSIFKNVIWWLKYSEI